MSYAQDLAAFNMLEEKRKINAENTSNAQAFNSLNAVLNLSKEANIRAAREAGAEVLRVSSNDILKEKDILAQKGSAIALSQGVTAGAAKKRSIMTYALQGAERVGTLEQKAESVANKINIQAESENNALASRQISAINEFKSKLISAPEAALRIQAAGIKGEAQGAEQDRALRKEQESIQLSIDMARQSEQNIREKTSYLAAINQKLTQKG